MPTDEEAILAALDFPLPRICMWLFDCPNHGVETCPQDATVSITCTDCYDHTSVEVMCRHHAWIITKMLTDPYEVKFSCPHCQDQVPLVQCVIEPIIGA